MAILLPFAPSTVTVFPGENILKDLDIADNKLAGEWQKHISKDIVRCTKADLALLQLPAPPEGEYTFRVVCTRTDGDGPLGVVLVRGDEEFTFMIGGKISENTEGFALADRQSTGQNAIKGKRKPVEVENDEALRLVVAVREEMVTVRVNGKAVASHKSADGELALARDYVGIGDGHLGLIAMNAGVEFHEVSVKPIKKPVQRAPTRKAKEDNGGDGIVGFPKGTKWYGSFTDNLNDQGNCGLTITEVSGNEYTAHLRYTSGRALGIKFRIDRGKVHVIDVFDKSSSGARQITGTTLDFVGDRVIFRASYIVSTRTRKNQQVYANFEMQRR